MTIMDEHAAHAKHKEAGSTMMTIMSNTMITTKNMLPTRSIDGHDDHGHDKHAHGKDEQDHA